MIDSPTIFYVYAYFRPDGRPCYVGKGKGDRWLHRGKWGRNQHFISIRDKATADGVEMPRMKLIEGLTEAEALQLEAFFIAAIGREANGGPLVNLTDGGEVSNTGYVWTEEQRKAHGDKRRGKSHSPEWRAAISAGTKDKPKSESHIAAVSKAQRGGKKQSGWWSTEEGRALQAQNNPGHSGHRHSAVSKEKIRRATIRQFASSLARKAVQTSPSWARQNSVRYPATTAA